MSTPGQPAILFADARFVVIDKPAGLPVHPGPRSTASVEDVFPLLSRRRAGPWLAHRLDADTSGCLVIALRRAALIAAQAEFAAGRVRKTYWAVVRGRPSADSGRIDLPLSKRSTRLGWRMVADPAGETAVTEWRVMAAADGLAWLELRPRTGRTHQLRVHCATLGYPIAGDAVYGGGEGPLQLHARAIWVGVSPAVSAVADLPGHMMVSTESMGLCPKPRWGLEAPDPH